MRHTLGTLAKLTASTRAAERLQALQIMREQIEAGRQPGGYLEVARRLIGDADNTCRWQALIVVGEYVLANPEVVWQVICEHGVSEDEDMRNGVATVLLEHLLEYHFDLYFPRLKERIEAGALLLADTLARCWAFGQAVPRWVEVEALIEQAGIEP
jgi:hypothetical protein